MFSVIYEKYLKTINPDLSDLSHLNINLLYTGYNSDFKMNLFQCQTIQENKSMHLCKYDKREIMCDI